MKNWKTSLFGLLFGAVQVSTTLANSGTHIGHFGGGDFTQLIAGLGTVILGVWAHDPKPEAK